MSHFLTLVFHEENQSIEDMLAPYDEQLPCAPFIKYTRKQAIEYQRQNFLDYKNGLYAQYIADPEGYAKKCSNEGHLHYLKTFPEKLRYTDEQLLKEFAKHWDEDMIDENYNFWSTYSPNAKWDWYEEGGRWNHFLESKSNSKDINTLRISDVIWDFNNPPFAYLQPNDIWREHGEMFYFGISKPKISDEDWKKQFKKYVESLNDDIYVTVVDCHI